MADAAQATRDYYALYDLLHSAKDYDAEVARVLDAYAARARDTPARVLDVGCGTGGHSFAFARRGLSVVACDLEAAAVERARERAATEGVRDVTFVAGDVAGIPPTEAPLAVAMFNVANYLLTRPALDAFFAAIASHQPAGGLLAFDAWNGVAVLRDPPRSEHRTIEARDEHLDVRVEPGIDLLRERVTLDLACRWSAPGRADREVRFRYEHRLWTPETIRESLDAVGYDLDAVERLAAPGEAAGPDDWKVLYLARRRAR